MVDMLDSLARLHITLQKQEEVKLLQMSCSMVSDPRRARASSPKQKERADRE